MTNPTPPAPAAPSPAVPPARRRVTAALKALRASQPFNRVATSAVRAALWVAGRRPEWVVRHLHRVGGVRVRLPDGQPLQLWSRGDDWVSNQLYWRGWDGYEPETTRLFYRLARRAAVTLDVGAYVGFYTLVAAHANPHGRVYAFEPLPPVADRLRANIRLNRLANAEAVTAAAGDAEGAAPFYHAPTDLPTSSSLSLAFMSPGGEAAGLQATTVPVVRLDRFAEERGLGRVDLVKMDTESTEPQVLAGMPAVLRRDRPHIVCEVLAGRGSEAALEAALAPLGYRFYLLTPRGPEPVPHVRGHPEWLNYLFTTLGPAEAARL